MIHGVLNVYKEKGYTSHDVVAKLRGIVKQKKIGHTGTLDPDAEGVLPVCFGKATKLCDLLTDKDKTYQAVLLLGQVTDTQDTSGQVLEKHSTEDLTNEKVENVIRSFEGEYDQIPPMYSALKVNGKKLYELAREGKEVERKARRITIHEIRILEILSAQFGRVSNERLICGPGLVNIHRALCEIAGVDPGLLEPKDITARAAQGDALGMRAVDVFCAVFGAIAGDLVLTLGAWDGVFLTGGLVPKMLDSLRHSGFRQRFEYKGRFSPTMARVPSLAVVHPRAGLLGAAAYAVDLLRREAA